MLLQLMVLHVRAPCMLAHDVPDRARGVCGQLVSQNRVERKGTEGTLESMSGQAMEVFWSRHHQGRANIAEHSEP